MPGVQIRGQDAQTNFPRSYYEGGGPQLRSAEEAPNGTKLDGQAPTALHLPEAVMRSITLQRQTSEVWFFCIVILCAPYAPFAACTFQLDPFLPWPVSQL